MNRSYSDSDKAYALEVLSQTNGNLSKAAEITGYPRKTIGYWAQQTGVRGLVISHGEQERSSGEERSVEGSVEGALGARNGKQNVPVRRMGTEDDRQVAVRAWRRARDLNLAELTDPAKVKKASLFHNNITAGTAQDKLNILTGGPTARLEHGFRLRYFSPDGTRFDDGDEPLGPGQFVAPGTLRRLARGLMDAPALPAGKIQESTKPPGVPAQPVNRDRLS